MRAVAGGLWNVTLWKFVAEMQIAGRGNESSFEAFEVHPGALCLLKRPAELWLTLHSSFTAKTVQLGKNILAWSAFSIDWHHFWSGWMNALKWITKKCLGQRVHWESKKDGGKITDGLEIGSCGREPPLFCSYQNAQKHGDNRVVGRFGTGILAPGSLEGTLSAWYG